MAAQSTTSTYINRMILFYEKINYEDDDRVEFRDRSDEPDSSRPGSKVPNESANNEGQSSSPCQQKNLENQPFSPKDRSFRYIDKLIEWCKTHQVIVDWLWAKSEQSIVQALRSIWQALRFPGKESAQNAKMFLFKNFDLFFDLQHSANFGSFYSLQFGH